MDWNSSALWGIIGLIGGFIISYFFYSKGIKRKCLIYDITTTAIVSENVTHIKELSIKYQNNPIHNLYISTISIRNAGNTVMEPDDFAPAAQLSLATNGEFLTASDNEIKLIPENSYNKISLLMDNTEENICKKAQIEFDYISKKDIILCTMFHTTPSLHITGKLKEGDIRNTGIRTDISLTNASIIGVIFGATITGFFSLIMFFLQQYISK